MVLVGISGKRRSGKTLLANILANQYGIVHLSLAEPLKAMCRELFDLTEDQVNGQLKEVVDTRYNLTPRQIMIFTGKFFRAIDPLFWIKKVETRILQIPKAQTAKVVISDIRFKNEADWVKRHNGFLLRLERAVELTGDPINDTSETELDYYSDFSLRIPESSNVDYADAERIALEVVDRVIEWE